MVKGCEDTVCDDLAEEVHPNAEQQGEGRGTSWYMSHLKLTWAYFPYNSYTPKQSTNSSNLDFRDMKLMKGVLMLRCNSYLPQRCYRYGRVEAAGQCW